MSRTRELRIERMVAASPVDFFAALISPERLLGWWGGSQGTATFCEVDPRPGGRWRICVVDPDGAESWTTGEYEVVSPPFRLVMRLSRELPDGQHRIVSRISFECMPHPAGTRLVFRHICSSDEVQPEAMTQIGDGTRPLDALSPCAVAQDKRYE